VDYFTLKDMANNLLRHYILKIWFKFLDLVLIRIKASVPWSLKNTRNIFIYFDYEREFGGHETYIDDNNIKYLLDILKEDSIKTTWFTVGMIFEKYPESIKEIIESGHEIGSHTFSHITPLNEKKIVLSEDFRDFFLHSRPFGKVYGFHSPRSRWAYKMFEYLFRYNFKYDVIGNKNGKPYKPFYLYYRPFRKILRFHTIDDDWPLYRDKVKDEKMVYDYFVRLSTCIKSGEFGGIGFHPWILFSDPNIIKGFCKFVGYLKQQKDIELNTLNYYYNKIIE